MDWTAWGLDQLNWLFFARALNIILIDLILSGDNAVVIAMAVRSLPRRQRLWGIALGAGAAVLLRIVLTFFVAHLLGIPYLKMTGGILINWIAVRLFVKGTVESGDQKAGSLQQAIWLIVVADLTMSLDNVLSVAGASHGNLFLLIFGLVLSIPLVVFTSNLLSWLMDRYPVILYIGAAILGRVAGEMIFSDPAVVAWLNPPHWLAIAMEVVFAVGVIVMGKIWLWLIFRKAQKQELTQELGTPGGSFKAPQSEEN
jgi:YjbE family integral membrane protein